MWQQQKLRKFCEEKGILVSVYSPLGAIGTSWGSDRVLECQVLKDIAHSKGKTVAQVMSLILFRYKFEACPEKLGS